MDEILQSKELFQYKTIITQKLNLFPPKCSLHLNKKINFICCLKDCKQYGLNCDICLNKCQKNHKEYLLPFEIFYSKVFENRNHFIKEKLWKYLEVNHQNFITISEQLLYFSQKINMLRTLFLNNYENTTKLIINQTKEIDINLKEILKNENSTENLNVLTKILIEKFNFLLSNNEILIENQRFNKILENVKNDNNLYSSIIEKNKTFFNCVISASSDFLNIINEDLYNFNELKEKKQNLRYSNKNDSLSYSNSNINENLQNTIENLKKTVGNLKDISISNEISNSGNLKEIVNLKESKDNGNKNFNEIFNNHENKANLNDDNSQIKIIDDFILNKKESTVCDTIELDASKISNKEENQKKDLIINKDNTKEPFYTKNKNNSITINKSQDIKKLTVSDNNFNRIYVKNNEKEDNFWKLLNENIINSNKNLNKLILDFSE